MASNSRTRRSTKGQDLVDPAAVRAAFHKRSSEALERIAATAPLDKLLESLAAPTDVGTLARALSTSEAVGAAVISLEPLAPLIARNAEHRAELLQAAGGELSSSEVAAFLGISRQAVDKRRQSNSLLGIKRRGDWSYPRCQFDEVDHNVVTELPRFLKGLKASSPWVALDVLLAPDDALGGRTPLDVLQTEGWTGSLERLVRIQNGDGFG